MSDFLGGAPHHNTPVASPSSTVPQADAAYCYAPPLTTAAGRLKLVVVDTIGASDRTPASAVAVLRSVLTRSFDMLPQVQPTVLRL